MCMKYWKVSLLREGRTAREWHVRAEALTVGSHGSNLVRLPPPVAAFALRLTEAAEPEIHEVGNFVLRIEDESAARETLWAQAQERLEHSTSAAFSAPRETPAPARIAIATLTLMGLTNLAASFFVDGRPQALRDFQNRQVAQSVALAGTAKIGVYQAPSAISDSQAQPQVAEALVRSNADSRTQLQPAYDGAPVSKAQNHGQSWDGVALAACIGCFGSSGPSPWASSTPEHYQAPWPDSPVPPH